VYQGPVDSILIRGHHLGLEDYGVGWLVVCGGRSVLSRPDAVSPAVRMRSVTSYEAVVMIWCQRGSGSGIVSAPATLGRKLFIAICEPSSITTATALGSRVSLAPLLAHALPRETAA
jgi:hypothetical protein